MCEMASQTTCVSIVCSTVSSGTDQRKHQISASLALVRGIHRWPVDSPQKEPVTRKCFHLMTSSSCRSENKADFITMTSQWAWWRLRSPASRLFTQPFIRADQRKHKAPRHWPLCGDFTGTGEFPAQKGSNAENVSIWWRHHGCALFCCGHMSV